MTLRTATLLLVLGCGELPPPAAPASPAFSYLGPGSMGRFPDVAAHPSWPDVLVAGADVGGVYASDDHGASWTNITRDLPSNGVWAVAFAVTTEGEAEITRVVLGTDSGLFVSDAVDSSAGIELDALDHWAEAGGLEVGDARPLPDTVSALRPLHGNQFSLPIGALAVSEASPGVVWAGVSANAQLNLAQDPKDPASLQRFDRWKVFRSVDSGVTFAPALRFSAPVAGFLTTPFDSPGSVFDILADPDDAALVWVSSDHGLYRSENADADDVEELVWEEIGAEARRRTEDRGVSWTETDPACVLPSVDPAAGSWCLPVQTEARERFAIDPEDGGVLPGYEEHPNLRGLARSEVDGVARLYGTVWDRGHADDEPADCSAALDGDSFIDTTLGWTRGGVYASDDGGESWSWLFTDTGRPGSDADTTALMTAVSYRCDRHSSERNSDDTVTFFGDIAVRPVWEEGDHLVVSALGYQSGLYGYDPGYRTTGAEAWTWLTNTEDEDFYDRFEGNQTLNITGNGEVEASRLLADWDSATEGYPTLTYTQRGLARGTWSSADGFYTFEHLGSDYLGKTGTTRMWRGTGLDDTVVWDVAEYEDALFVGISDGGVLQMTEGSDGTSFINIAKAAWTPNWSVATSDNKEDEARAVEVDPEREVLYVGAFVTSEPYLYQVLRDEAGTWTVIGGRGYTSDATRAEEVSAEVYNGFYSGSPLHRIEVNDLAALPPSAGLDVDLLAATSFGLWSYDAELAAGAQWEPLCPELAEGESFPDLFVDLDTGMAFAAAEDVEQGGLLVLDLATDSCEALSVRVTLDEVTGSTDTRTDPVKRPSAVALATDPDSGEQRLIVGVDFEGYVGLLSGVLDCTATCTVSEWRRVFTGAGLYEEDSARDLAFRRFEVSQLAVDPLHPGVVWAAFGLGPGYDDYNPDSLLRSEDGGQSFTTVDLTSAAANLPSRNLHLLSFSEDGTQLFAGSRASLYRATLE